MNENELKEKIEKLENELAELKKSLNKPQEEYKRWRAEGHEIYYRALTKSGNIATYSDNRDDTDNFLYLIGNYFKTQEETEIYKENLITKQKLKDLATRLNKGVGIDWKDENQLKYSIKLDYLSGGLCQTLAKYSRYPSAICCLDDCFIQIARQEIGEEKLIELIKSGV